MQCKWCQYVHNIQYQIQSQQQYHSGMADAVITSPCMQQHTLSSCDLCMVIPTINYQHEHSTIVAKLSSHTTLHCNKPDNTPCCPLTPGHINNQYTRSPTDMQTSALWRLLCHNQEAAHQQLTITGQTNSTMHAANTYRDRTCSALQLPAPCIRSSPTATAGACITHLCMCMCLQVGGRQRYAYLIFFLCWWGKPRHMALTCMWV